MKIDAKIYPVIFWVILITVLSLIPSSNVPDISWEMGLKPDKVAHILIYGIYTWLLGRYLWGKWKKMNKVLLVSFITTVVYGVFMESLQYYLSPSRFFDMLDIIANIIGSTTGLIFLKIKI